MSALTGDALATAVLAPSVVAIVGASDDPTKTTARPQQFLAQAGFEGGVYFINPRRETVQGVKAWPSLRSLPQVPDHAYVMTGAEAAIEAVRECAEIGVPVATILASGFAEDGPEGRDREDRLCEAAAGRVRLIGPSSLGVVNPRNGVMLTGNAAFGEPDTPKGGIFVASQSGSVIGALVSRARGRGVGFAGLVSVGGEADLSVGELCEATLADDGIESYALFLESLRHADKLASFARAAGRAGKPVAVYKLGRSEEAAELAVSHTGALTGSDAEAEAFLRGCGFARVGHFESLVEAPALLRQVPVRGDEGAPRIGVITTTGGGAAILVDQLATRGMKIVGPSAGLLGDLAAAGVDIPHSLIADLGLAGARHDIVSAAVRLMQESGEFDLLVFVIGSSARLNPELAVEAIAERGGHDVPLVAFAVPEAPEAAALLQSSGVPAFRTPESCADVIASAFTRRAATIGPARPVQDFSTATVLDEQASAVLLADIDVPMAPSVALDVADIGSGLPLPFEYPVVVKVLSADVAHKSDVGGVVVGVEDDAGLEDAVRRIKSSVQSAIPHVEVDRVLVQPMVGEAVADVLIGYRVAPDVGPIVVLSTGGVLAEVFADTSVRLAPVTAETAREMIAEVKGLALAAGYRNSPKGDLDALAQAVVAMSQLAVSSPEVAEAEANPVMVRRDGLGVIAVDALVRAVGGGADEVASSEAAASVSL
ncbi:acetate--CoA ligase family protein [Nocardioides sp. NBC_00368]|uniref:acetate--CoA ligase family protein n=1 Tax=Nocardioides sp. NBC_00368 TaxID=2976000 RepID=UPI002E1D65E1